MQATLKRQVDLGHPWITPGKPASNLPSGFSTRLCDKHDPHLEPETVNNEHSSGYRELVEPTYRNPEHRTLRPTCGAILSHV